MIKTIASQCPDCSKINCFNVPFNVTNVKDISVSWFQCSFCHHIIKKQKWS